MSDSKDLVLSQRLASGYVPGKSETFGVFPASPFTANPLSGPTPTTCKLQNCQVFRPVGVAVGTFDVIVGPAQTIPPNVTSLRSGGDPAAPVGIGGALAGDPPLNVAGGGIVVNSGRASTTVRSTITNPVTSVNPQLTYAVQYGASLGAVPLYPGFSNSQIVRFIFDAGDVATDADFDFWIERVIDPSVES